MSERLVPSEEQMYMSNLEESRRLIEEDGISTSPICLFSLELSGVYDPISTMNCYHTGFKELPDYQQAAINLRVQKCGVIQLADKRRQPDKRVYYWTIPDEETLNEAYAEARSYLNRYSDYLFKHMDEDRIPYEFTDPFHGTPLPKHALKLFMFYSALEENKWWHGNKRSEDYSYAQSKCHQFYQQFRTLLIPENTADRFYHRLYGSNRSPKELFEETLSSMQEELLQNVYHLLTQTFESTGALKQASNNLSSILNKRVPIDELFTRVPAAIRAYLKYYEQLHYALPFSSADISDKNIPDAIAIMRTCAAKIAEIEDGTRAIDQLRIDRINRYLDRTREKTIRRQKVALEKAPKQRTLDQNQPLIAQFGLDPQMVEYKWQQAARIPQIQDGPDEEKYYADTVMEENFLQMLYLEGQRPGITKALYDAFGIVNYCRCPNDIWIDQFDHMYDPDMEYGTVLFANEDWNGAFLGKQDVWQEFYNSIKEGGQHIRVIEAADKDELRKYLLFMRTHYRPLGSWGLITAHGHKNGFRLSGNANGNVTVEDIKSIDGKIALQFLKRRAPLGMISCSTGTYEGLAHNISLETDGIVFGPDTPSNIQKLLWQNDSFYLRYTFMRPQRYQKGRHIR